MPWLETEPMLERVKFISAYHNNEEASFQELCERFHISRKTGYKYLHRFEENGVDGLKDLSRARIHQENRVSLLVEDNILEVKARYPHWGAKKIKNWLMQEKGDVIWPARSTIDELLKRHGLVKKAKRNRRVTSYQQPLALCNEPNDSWSIDYKGQFQLGNEELCYPFTVTDNFSRYLLAVEGFPRIATKNVKDTLTQLFLDCGLPQAIRSDNGSPFASTAIGGLSDLSVWLIKLGIIPERITKGRPQENGRHERMHLTLKKETASPPMKNPKTQQRRFDEFRREFNEDRPHEGIEFNRPAWLYKPSERTFPSKIAAVEYGDQFEKTRKVRTNGTIKWEGKCIYISETLKGEPIAMKPHSEDEWVLYFSFMPLAIFNERTLKVSKLC